MKRALFMSAFLVLSLFAASCSSLKFMYTDIGKSVASDLTAHPERGVARDERRILYIMVDGIRGDLLKSMMEKGELPNIKKYVYDRGAVADPAITSAPSVTYAIMTAMLSGRYPGHTGVPGMYWYDRKTLENRHYPRCADLFKVNGDVRCPIIFDYLKDNDDYSVTIFWPLFRNTGRYARMFYNSLRAVVFNQWLMHDMECVWNVNKIYDASAGVGRYPKFVLLYLIATDVHAHLYGWDSKEYRDTLRFYDKHLGEMFLKLEKSGELDNLLVVFATDHGMTQHNREKHFNLVDAMGRDLGLRVQHGLVSQGWTLKQRIEYYNKFHALVAISGRRYAFVYLNNQSPGASTEVNLFKKPVPYERIRNYEVREGVSYDLIPTLVNYKAVDCAIIRKTPNSLAVFGKSGESLIERRIADGVKTYRYSVVKGRDPLGYDDDANVKKMLDGKFHGDREWLKASARAEHPDTVVQVTELFDEPDRMGDIVLFAAEGCEFIPGQMGGHGGLNKGDMVAQTVFAGPGIRKCRFGPVRLVDLMPSMMEYLGMKTRTDAPPDGRSFLGDIMEKGR